MSAFGSNVLVGDDDVVISIVVAVLLLVCGLIQEVCV